MFVQRQVMRWKSCRNHHRIARSLLTLIAVSLASFATADSTVLVSTSGSSASLAGAVKSFAVTASGSTWTQQANFNSDAWANVSASGQSTGLTQDIYGNVYVGVVSGTNASNGIRIYRQTGGASVGYLSSTWGSGNLSGNGPDGLAIGANGTLYATITFGSGNNKLLTFDTTTLSGGQVQTSQAGTNTGLTGMTNPRGLTVASDGNLYIASRNGNQVLRYPGSGTSATVLSGSFLGPQGLAWDARNDRLVVSTNQSNNTAIGTLTLAGSANTTAVSGSIGGAGSWTLPVETTIAIANYISGSSGALFVPVSSSSASTVASLPGPSYMLVVRDTRLWSGGSGNWGSGTTWTHGIGGTTGSATFTSGSGASTLPSILTFTGSGGTATNDVSGTPFVGGINFAPGAGSYTLSGNPFTLGLNANIRNLTTTGTQTIAADVTVLGSQWIYTEAGSTLTMSGAVSGVGTQLTKVGAGVLAFSGSNSYSGGTTITAGTLRVGAGGTSGSLGSGGVVNNGVLVFNRSDDYGGAFSNAISGTGALALAGGTLTLSASNAYTGATSINAGALVANNTNALAATGTITFGGGVLRYSANNTVDYASKIAGSSSAIAVDTNGQAVTFGSPLGSANVGGLTKSGSGRLSLNAANLYSGATTISAGTLALGLNGSFANSQTITIGNAGSSGAVLDLSAKTGAFTFASSQTVGGIGTLKMEATDTAQFSGVFSPGNSPGLFTLDGGTTLLSGTAHMEILGSTRGTAYDAVDLINAAVLNYSSGTLLLDFGSTLAAVQSYQLFGDGLQAIGGSLSAVTIVGNKYNGLTFTRSDGVWTSTGSSEANQTLTFTESTGTLVIVPEPEAMALAGLGIALAGWATRRRWR